MTITIIGSGDPTALKRLCGVTGGHGTTGGHSLQLFNLVHGGFHQSLTSFIQLQYCGIWNGFIFVLLTTWVPLNRSICKCLALSTVPGYLEKQIQQILSRNWSLCIV